MGASSCSKGFRLLAKTKANGVIPVWKYISVRTGLQVVISDVEGPLIVGKITLATETSTDEGLPHTLEHLVFMGSEKYPYKGTLDVLANRCLASGTNAYTAVDHTTYELETASLDGFLLLLPVYMDHVLNPLLTDEHYLTEVHHINGDGEDGGVVYCEEQDDEGNSREIAHQALMKFLFPPPCGYGAHTGGRVHDIREYCNNQKVKMFHNTFYCPNNLSLAVSGKIDHDRLFSVIELIDKELSPVMKTKSEKLSGRPWIDKEVPPLTESVSKSITCPSDDESNSLVLMGFRGPTCRVYRDLIALEALMEYLTAPAISPLETTFVQIAEPYCSTINYSMLDQSESAVVLEFQGTDVTRQCQIKSKFFECLSNIRSGAAPFSLQRMKDVVHNLMLNQHAYMEKRPHEAVSALIISDFLYGISETDFEDRLNPANIFDGLKMESESFWMELLDKYLLQNNYIHIDVKPSMAMVEELSKQEEERLETRCLQMGKEKLAKCQALLDSALANKEVRILLDTSRLSLYSKLFIPLYLDLLFESPIEENCVVVPYKKVVQDLDADLISYAAEGEFESFGRFIALEFEIDEEKCKVALQRIHGVVKNLVFTEERVIVAMQRIINSAALDKQDGYNMATLGLRTLNYVHDSLWNCKSILRQERFLSEMLEKMKTDATQILDELNKLKETVTAPESLFVNVLHNAKNLQKLGFNDWTDALKQWLVTSQQSCSKGIIYAGEEPHYLKAKECFGRGVIIPVSGSESSYVRQCALMNIKSTGKYMDPELPALHLFLHYLRETEGPLYKAVRGKGLAYDVGIDLNIDSGLLSLKIYSSVDPVQAFKSFKDVVDGYLIGNLEVENERVKGAKSSLIFELISREATIRETSYQRFISHFRGVSPDWLRKYADSIWMVDAKDMLNVGKKHLPSLFNFSMANTSVTCHPSKLKDVLEGFQKLGKSLDVAPLESDVLSSWEQS